MRDRPRTPQSLFDLVAPYYDVLNSCLSFGLDRYWRRRAVRLLDLQTGATVLDLATGTASLALTLARQPQTDIHIVACDLNERMLQVGRQRLVKRKFAQFIELICCTGTDLPFGDGVFDAVTIGFAIDDMPSRRACALEMFRVLKAGGALVLLELSLPHQPLFLSLYRFYLRLISLVGSTVRLRGYKHLQEEILTYRGSVAIQRLLEDAGFGEYESETFSGGLATVHRATKPEQSIN